MSLGVIQSRTTPFKLLVSSDLALDIPFWIFNGWGKGLKLMWATDVLNRLSSWSLHWMLPWGAQLDGAPSTKVFETLDTPSWPCIWDGYISLEIDELEKNGTNSKVSVSSATSPSSAIWSIPFTINACILHMACTVLLKCCPWWINRSPAWLIMGHAHSLILFFLFSFFVSLPTPLSTPTIAYIHILRDAQILYSHLPLFTFLHLYSLAWHHPPIPQL